MPETAASANGSTCRVVTLAQPWGNVGVDNPKECVYLAVSVELLIPLATFLGTCLLIALFAWWSGAWRSVLSGIREDVIDPSRDPELLLRSTESQWIENHEFWQMSEVEEIAL